MARDTTSQISHTSHIKETWCIRYSFAFISCSVLCCEDPDPGRARGGAVRPQRPPHLRLRPREAAALPGQVVQGHSRVLQVISIAKIAALKVHCVYDTSCSLFAVAATVFLSDQVAGVAQKNALMRWVLQFTNLLIVQVYTSKFSFDKLLIM